MYFYSSDFNNDAFWPVLKKYAKRLGLEVVEKALWLYYAAQKPEVPAATKAIIYSALAYLALPVDLIPDVMVFGLSDDIAVILGAVAKTSFYIDEDVRQQARRKMQDWFGNDLFDS